MPHKDPEKAQEYHARYMREVWYPKNKLKHIGYVRRNKERVAAFIENYKKKRFCADCGFPGKEFPYVLDFDHLCDSTSKKFNVGSWSHSVLSIKAIEEEMKKCELVCANCHRIRTFSKKKLRSN